MQKGSLNKAQLIGHLGAEPESRFTKSGACVTNFNIATNESWKDKDGKVQDVTEWHKVVMFGKMAETAAEYLKKGQLVYVEGRMKTDSWLDDQQVKRYSTSVNADVFTMLGKKDKEEYPKQNDDGDDLPF